VRVLSKKRKKKDKYGTPSAHSRANGGGGGEAVLFVATRKDVGSFPFGRGPTSQGSMNPGRAPRWSSAHCPRGVPAMKMTPLQASNLKQEDNLRPKKLGNTVNDTTKKGGLFGFFFLLAADNLVADPLTRVRP
jgi:hypothetical protein